MPRTRAVAPKRKLAVVEDEDEEEKQNITKKQKQEKKGKKTEEEEDDDEDQDILEKNPKNTTAKDEDDEVSDEDMDEDRDEDEDDDDDDDDDGKNKGNKKSDDEDSEEEEEDPERPQLDQVSIPSWSSITLPPITSHPCDIPGTTEESKFTGTHIYGKGICSDIFQGKECKNISSSHHTQFLHQLPPQHTSHVNTKKVAMTDIFPIYGHPTLIYAEKYKNENKDENKDEIEEMMKMTEIPKEIGNIVCEYLSAPSLNVFWRADIEYFDDDDDNEDDEDAARMRHWKNEIQKWEKNEKNQGNNRVIVPNHPQYAIRSHFGGLGYLRPAESPPRCGECNKIMPLYVQIRLSDMPRDAAIGYALPNIPIQRQLLQCWGCCDKNARSFPLCGDEDDMKAEDEDEIDGSGVLIRIIDMGDDTLKCDAMESLIKERREIVAKKREEQDQDQDEDDFSCFPWANIERWIEYPDIPSPHEWNDLLSHYHDDKIFKRKYHQENYYQQKKDQMIKLGGYCDVNVDVDEGDSAYSTCSLCNRQMQIVIQIPSTVVAVWGESEVRASIQQCPVHRDHFVFAWTDPADCS